MSQYKHAEIADTVYFWFAANATTGAADDGATPLYDVRLAGAAADAAPTASGTPTLLSHASYGAGLHEIAIDTTGHAAGEYAVFCTLTVSAVNPGGFCGSYKLRAAGTAALTSDMVAIHGTALTETAGQLAAGFKKCFDVATPLLDSSENYLTVTEFEARSLVSADYTIVADLGTVQSADNNTLLTAIAGYLDTEIAALVAAIITNAAGTDIAADIIALKAVADTVATGTTTDIPALIATAQSDLDKLTGADGATLATLQGNYAPNVVVPDAAGTAPTAAEIKTAMEADAGDLSSLMEALVNKAIWTEADGQLEMFNDSDVSQGTIAAQIATDGTYTTRKRAFK